jgi:hypothetical protein
VVTAVELAQGAEAGQGEASITIAITSAVP